MMTLNKISRGKSIFFFLLLLISGAFCFAGAGHSQQDPRIATGVQVSPVRFDWDMNAGEERTGVINLKNYAEYSFNVDIELEDFYVTDDTTEARFFIPNKEHPLYAYDVISWIDVPKNVHLNPGEGKDISFKVKVPENTPTGGYYGALFFKTAAGGESGNDRAEDQDSKIKIYQRVGTLLVLAVKGPEKIERTGLLQSFRSLRKIFWSSPVKLEAVVSNTGNIHYKAMGYLDIYKFGKKKDSVEIDQRMLYPGKYRKYESDWSFSPWGYGFYRAKFNLFSEDMQIKMAGETAFWVVPWKTTVAIIILIFIIWMIYKIFDSRFEIHRKGDDPETGDMRHETGVIQQTTSGVQQKANDMQQEIDSERQAIGAMRQRKKEEAKKRKIV